MGRTESGTHRGTARARGWRGGAVVVAVLLGTVACSPAADPNAGSSQAASSGEAVTIYLTRHGETMLNELDRVQGWSDSPLTDSGEADAEDLGKGLREENIDFAAAYSADTLRQYETADRALEAADIDLDITRDERLREMAFGPFEGAKNRTMWDKIARDKGYQDQKALDQHMDEVGFLNAVDSIPTVAGKTDLPVETCDQVGDRALDALRDIADDRRDGEGENVLVVSSGITILCLLDQLDADLKGIDGIDNAAVTELRHENGDWTVGKINDTSYVDAGA